jgi:hypothetical protein
MATTHHPTSTPGGLRPVGHHPLLTKLIVVWLFALLIAAASRTRPLLWPLLIYGWAAATTGGLLLLWRVERHNTPAVPASTYDTRRSVNALPEYIRQLRFDYAHHPKLAAWVRRQLPGRGRERGAGDAIPGLLAPWLGRGPRPRQRRSTRLQPGSRPARRATN